MNNFWRTRLWIEMTILIFLWTIFDGPRNLAAVRGGLPAQAGAVVGSVLAMSLWIIVFEAFYWLITWPARKKKHTRS